MVKGGFFPAFGVQGFAREGAGLWGRTCGAGQGAPRPPLRRGVSFTQDAALERGLGGHGREAGVVRSSSAQVYRSPQVYRHLPGDERTRGVAPREGGCRAGSGRPERRSGIGSPLAPATGAPTVPGASSAATEGLRRASVGGGNVGSGARWSSIWKGGVGARSWPWVRGGLGARPGSVESGDYGPDRARGRA